MSTRDWNFTESLKEDSSTTTRITFAYSSSIDNKMWYQLEYFYDDTGDKMIIYQYDNNIINKNFTLRLPNLGFKPLKTYADKDGLNKLYANYDTKIIIIITTKSQPTGYGQLTTYQIHVGNFPDK